MSSAPTTASTKSDSRAWGDAIKVVRPTFAGAKDGGTHVNISGAAVAKHAPNKANAVKLLLQHPQVWRELCEDPHV